MMEIIGGMTALGVIFFLAQRCFWVVFLLLFFTIGSARSEDDPRIQQCRAMTVQSQQDRCMSNLIMDRAVELAHERIAKEKAEKEKSAK